jgi:hypothetical protein
MAKFIEVTMANGHAALLNVNHIVFITPMIDGSGNTAIGLTTGTERVTETATEILRWIDEAN